MKEHVWSQVSCFCQGDDNIQLDGVYVGKVGKDRQ